MAAIACGTGASTTRHTVGQTEALSPIALIIPVSYSSFVDSKRSTRDSVMETSASEGQRSCADCNTTKTPLWRGGPTGPKSLCNACGIRDRKKRRALMALNNKGQKCKRGRSRSKVGISFKMRLLAMGRDAVLQRYLLQKPRQLDEDEEAAVLLMTLSCGLVDA